MQPNTKYNFHIPHTEPAINHSSTVFEILSVEYPCEICDEHFSTRSDRNKHIENHFRSFECETCHQTFIGDRQFSYHQTTARCQPSADEPDPPPVPDTDEPTLTEWGCYVCGQKNFQTRRALKLHFNKQHTEKPKRSSANHVCDMCGKAFANQHILKNHVYEIHTNAQEHKCDDCGKQFNRLANLRHHQLIHRNLMPCDCVVCGKSFRTPSGVRLHMRTHTGAKPYKCDLCNEKSYAYNTDLVRHKRSMHGIYGKVFMCALCPSQYYERKHLRKHLTRTHEITDEEQILANIKAPAVKKEK